MARNNADTLDPASSQFSPPPPASRSTLSLSTKKKLSTEKRRRLNRLYVEKIANCALSGWNVLDVECPRHCGGVGSVSLPLVQNAEGHVYCVACEQYFAQAGEDLEPEAAGDSSTPHDRPHSAVSPQAQRMSPHPHTPRAHGSLNFVSPAGEEELALFRQLLNCQEDVQQARRVWECRRAVSELSHILERLQAVQQQRRF